MAERNNYIYMHHRGHHKQHILHMGLYSALAADGYNHPQSTPGQVYAQPGGQPSYGQPGLQAATSHAQVAHTGYGSYPSSQQTYPEQPASNNAIYGY